MSLLWEWLSATIPSRSAAADSHRKTYNFIKKDPELTKAEDECLKP
jgi:hypothetical protein